MYGSSDLGYQGTLKRLTANQRESNTARTAAHKAAQTETFMTGLEAKTNTVSQAACINELVGLAFMTCTQSWSSRGGGVFIYPPPLHLSTL